MSNKFHGQIGYGITVETDQDVWQKQTTERDARGDLKRDTVYIEASGAQVNSDLRMGNLVSIVADAFANEHYSDILYVRWRGARWAVTNVSIEAPRLVLRLGGVYNGPEPTPTA